MNLFHFHLISNVLIISHRIERYWVYRFQSDWSVYDMHKERASICAMEPCTILAAHSTIWQCYIEIGHFLSTLVSQNNIYQSICMSEFLFFRLKKVYKLWHVIFWHWGILNSVCKLSMQNVACAADKCCKMSAFISELNKSSIHSWW